MGHRLMDGATPQKKLARPTKLGGFRDPILDDLWMEQGHRHRLEKRSTLYQFLIHGMSVF